MLCPVCKKNPLTGRKSTAKTCSTKCRSILYRARKRQPSNTPQQAPVPDTSSGSAAARPPGLRPRSQRGQPAARLEQLVSTAAERIVEAIQKLGLPSSAQAANTWRVDMREQVTGQAPKSAVGYRLVLPGRGAGDPPKLLPARRGARDAIGYSLSPFEYPDDLRLRDGCWYRLVWLDAQGERIRLKPGAPIPGLYFFLGPPNVMISASEAAHSTAERSEIPPVEALPVEAPSAPTPAETGAQAQSIPPTAPSPAEQPKPSTEQGIRGISPATETAFLKLIEAYPQIQREDWPRIYGFVMQVPWMIWLLNEERRQQAVARGLPAPREPVLALAAREREVMVKIARSAPPYFIPFCKILFMYLHDHGTEILELAPEPFFPLPAEQQQQVLRASRDPNQRAYMDYVCRWQDAQLDQQSLPDEPQVKLRSEQRNEIKKLLVDLRAVMFFRRLATSVS